MNLANWEAIEFFELRPAIIRKENRGQRLARKPKTKISNLVFWQNRAR